LQAHQQVVCLGVAQHVGDGFLGDAKGRHGHFFRDAGQPLLAFQAPVHRGVFQGLEQVRAQAGFQAQAGELSGVEDGRDVAHLGQGLVQGIAQDVALGLQLIRHTALDPFALQLGGGQQLPDVVMQFAAEAVAFVFLHLQQAIGQFLGLELDGFARVPLLQAYH